MNDNNFHMKHNCLNCKHCVNEMTCDKDGSDIEIFPITQELTCCELSDLAKRNEALMNISDITQYLVKTVNGRCEKHERFAFKNYFNSSVMLDLL